jgi:hypothetical protein
MLTVKVQQNPCISRNGIPMKFIGNILLGVGGTCSPASAAVIDFWTRIMDEPQYPKPRVY